MNSFLICSFSKHTFANLIKEAFNSDFYEIVNKKQFKYIYDYLENLEAKSILLEKNYLDKDYLEDFSRYYIKSFKNKGFITARLHFFDKQITHKDINDLLVDNQKVEDLQVGYLGFMVIKPLAQTFIGKTCFKLYADFNTPDSDKKCLTREYNVNLFGINLKIDSLAFQEQDKVVSACATTAIWTILQGTPGKLQNDIPACSEITTNAINHINNSNNFFPKKELSNKQILRALDFEKLKHHSYDLDQTSILDFLNHIKLYIDSNIPLILGINVYEIRDQSNFNLLAGHAVSILGYKYNFSKKDQSIAIYVHDDRLGPYVRATFHERTKSGLKLVTLKETNLDCTNWVLAIQFKDNNGKWLQPSEFYEPSSLIVPTHKKIRLPATYAYNTCNIIINEYIEWIKEQIEYGNEEFKALDFNNLISFSIQLKDISSIKNDVLQSKILSVDPTDPDNTLQPDELNYLKEEKIKLLTSNFAKYQWVATFYHQNEIAFSILFDATQISQENAISTIYTFNKFASDAILEIFIKYAEDGNSYIQEVDTTETFYKEFIRSLRSNEEDYFTSLDKRFGNLRAPKYLKIKEVSEFDDILVNESVVKIYSYTNKKLDYYCQDIKEGKVDYMLWAISEDGALLLGEEIEGQGHPCLTGFKSARIAGEISYSHENGWKINAKSGRFSGDYLKKDEYLSNVVSYFNSLFIFDVEDISIQLDESKLVAG